MSGIYDDISTWAAVEDAVAELFGSRELAQAWLKKPMVRYFGLSAEQGWNSGHEQLVIEMVRQMAAGFVF